MADWLVECGVTLAAMESTSTYWTTIPGVGRLVAWTFIAETAGTCPGSLVPGTWRGLTPEGGHAGGFTRRASA